MHTLLEWQITWYILGKVLEKNVHIRGNGIQICVWIDECYKKIKWKWVEKWDNMNLFLKEEEKNCQHCKK